MVIHSPREGRKKCPGPSGMTPSQPLQFPQSSPLARARLGLWDQQLPKPHCLPHRHPRGDVFPHNSL